MKTYQLVYMSGEDVFNSTKVNASILRDGHTGDSIGKYDNLAEVLNYMAKNGWEYISHTESLTERGYVCYTALFCQESE